jgi:hypothetical protein
MPTILDGPQHLGAEALPSPPQRLMMPRTAGPHDLLSQLLADPIDGHESVTALVYIGSKNNHEGCLLHCEVTVGPVGGHISVGGDATLLSSHAGRSFTPDADKTIQRQPDKRQ